MRGEREHRTEGDALQLSPLAGEGGGAAAGRGGVALVSTEFARQLRRKMTDEERQVWYALRAGRLGGFKFRRQSPIGPFIADFVCFDHRLIVELDGGQHAEAEGCESDRSRTAWLESRGFRLLRFWNHEVREDLDAVLETIARALGGPTASDAPALAFGRPPLPAAARPPSPARGEGVSGPLPPGGGGLGRGGESAGENALAVASEPPSPSPGRCAATLPRQGGGLQSGPDSRRSRRGVTLMELMVVVGLLVLIMTILVEVFRSATGSLTNQRVYTQLDQELRRVSGMLHQDLAGTTARMTPPLNPADGLGYFTYGENALADAQGEDTDDYLAFTAKAPEGRPFTGSIVLPVQNGVPGSFQRVPITSDYAEIIYFLRNGNLYRRVFLILPEDRQDALTIGSRPNGASGLPQMNPNGGYSTNPPAAGQPYLANAGLGLYGVPMSWLGLNDISARPSPFSASSLVYGTPAETADATNTYVPILNTLGDLTNPHNRAFHSRFSDDYTTPDPTTPGGFLPVPDGIPDDLDGNGIPDYYPTLYPEIANNGPTGTPYLIPPLPASNVFDSHHMGFPFIYRNPYSQPDSNTLAAGAIHSLDPSVNPTPTAARPNFGSRLDPPYNHSPLDTGDPLGPPQQGQTWWGFPTKKETMSVYWSDPIKRVNDPPGAYFFAIPAYAPNADYNMARHAADTPLSQALPLQAGAALPPMTDDYRGFKQGQPYNIDPPPLNGPAGAATFTTNPPNLDVWKALTDEDLVLTGVRSFDVKALDPALATYVDLGYANRYAGTPFSLDTNGDNVPDYFPLKTFDHEGRIPPLINDNRSDAQWPDLTPNIGDDDPTILRLRRVWDSWSTDYSYPPYQTINPLAAPPFGKPPLVGYPPPYPAPLRGIQIQIRVTDPADQRVKILTIRQDFSSKL
jgi:very-short-patch-repair endonuclease/type II secretory pathway component PulJ